MEIIKLEFIGQKIEPKYGGQRITFKYLLKTSTEGIVNEYEVVAELGGLDSGTALFRFYSYKPLTNNEHTLIEDAVKDIMDDEYNWW